MIKQIVGGSVAIIIGGTAYTISQQDVVNNFSKNTGLTQQQAQQYINNIPQSELQSFNKVGQGFIDDGNSAINSLASIDCVSYVYKWESPTLSCADGKNQLQKIGNDEITLGNCYESLDTDLGSSGGTRINECITDIDTVNSDLSLPVATALLDGTTITDSLNTNTYNKSVLEAALNAR